MTGRSKKIRPSIHLIWADWIALATGLILTVFLLLFVPLAFVITGSLGATHMLDALGVKGIEFVFLVTGSIWILLRSVDYLARVSVRLVTNGWNSGREKSRLRDTDSAGYGVLRELH